MNAPAAGGVTIRKYRIHDFDFVAPSPGIDAGDQNSAPQPGATDLDGFRRMWDDNGDGTAVDDVGAFELGSYRYGDLNCDGLVNAFDTDPFVLALASPAACEPAHPDCENMLADVNGDLLLNAFDIDPFVLLLTGG
jgi:hypothetical protein